MRRLFIFATVAMLAHPAMTVAADKSLALPAFTAISSKGPVSIEVQVGKAQSVTARGTDAFLRDVVIEVVNGELLISMREKSNKVNNDARVLISMPALGKFMVEGAGEAILNNVTGPRVDISYKGAGQLTANGKVDWLRLKAQGVGDVDTRALKTTRADVNFEGIGAVKVHASATLNAIVRGMGSLEYFGKPPVVNKTVQGIGSVSAGD